MENSKSRKGNVNGKREMVMTTTVSTKRLHRVKMHNHRHTNSQLDINSPSMKQHNGSLLST